MYFIFIGGVQPRTKTLEEQPRRCASCGLHQAFLKRTDHYFSLFFIPLFAIQKGTPFLECRSCGSISGESGDLWQGTDSICAHCGARVEKTFRFCPACGKPLVRG